MFSFAAKKVIGNAKESMKDGKPDQSGGVNWTEFNFPPCITVVHFDPQNDPIPALAKKTVLRMRTMWFYAMAILAFNICTNIGFAADGTDASIVIFYSVLQFVVGSVAGGCVLYQGYRGVAGDLAQNSRIYLGLQTLLTILMLVFASIQSGNVHGLTGCTSRIDTASQPGYLIICIIEGTAWLVCTVFSCYCMYRVYRYPGHDRATRLESDASKRDKDHKKGSSGKHSRTANDEETPSEAKPKKSSKKKHKAPPQEEEV